MHSLRIKNVIDDGKKQELKRLLTRRLHKRKELQMTVDIATVFTSVLTLITVMLIGVAARITGVVNRDTTKRLSVILVNVIMPMMIISSMQIEYTPELFKKALGIIAASVVIHAVVIVISLFAYRKTPLRERKIYNTATVFGNCGYMGFPVLKAIFGDVGLFYGSIYVFVFNIILFSYGVFLFTRGTDQKMSAKKVFLNAGTVASVIGMLLFLLKIRLPSFIGGAIKMMGDMTFPMSMLIIGSLACRKGYKKLFSAIPVYFYAVLKLLLLPVLTLLACLLFKVGSDMMLLCVTMTAVPSATACASFADMYDCDAKLSAKLVGFSTVLSALTIPLMLMLASWIYKIAGL